MSSLDSIESIYETALGSSTQSFKAKLLLELRNWLTEISEFDPATGNAIPLGLMEVLEEIPIQKNSLMNEDPKDRVFKIIEHVERALCTITEKPKDKILREHTLMPIYAAREVDNISVQWLSKKSGRTLREKLAGKPYIKAVNRRTSVDTSENRLLKAFIIRLEQILFVRTESLRSTPSESIQNLQLVLERWFRNENMKEIGYWGNFPPNNTLLQDKQYRKVWDAWLWLQRLDEDIRTDYARLNQDFLTVLFWTIAATLKKSYQVRFVQQPILCGYDKFSLLPLQELDGYIFPSAMGEQKLGIIVSVNTEKGFGFIRSNKERQQLFFHANDLRRGTEFQNLKKNNHVSYSIGKNKRGECAKNIEMLRQPEKLNYTLKGSEIVLETVNNTIIIQYKNDLIELRSKKTIDKKTFECSFSSIYEISSKVSCLLLNVAGQNLSELKGNTNNNRLNSQFTIIDIGSTRPSFTTDLGLNGKLPFRLIQQYWMDDEYGKIAINCGYTAAINLTSEIDTVSMLSLFSDTENHSEGLKNDAAMSFAKRIHKYINTELLIYLVPDAINDFSLESVRRSINFCFSHSSPLPKSIAAIFAWQSSEGFQEKNITSGDVVIVIEHFNDVFSFTPVVGVYDKNLKKQLPETKGIYWERHPTQLSKQKSSLVIMQKNLEQDACLLAEELMSLFGFDGLVNEAGKLSCVDENNVWYHLPKELRQTLTKGLMHDTVQLNELKGILSSISPYSNKNAVFLLPLEDTIKKPSLEKTWSWLGSAWSLTKGGQILTNWQNQVEDLTLWKDHLPELSVKILQDGRYKNFYLVKDATITPQRGKKVPIPIKETFTLPAGQTHYSFPLLQGTGNQELKFIAYLKSPAFPLQKDTSCKLEMTYTYGADEPYELKFFDGEGFKSVKVEWRADIDKKPEDAPFPKFPQRKTWLEFESFPKDETDEVSNLLEWCRDKLLALNDLNINESEREHKLINERKQGVLDWGKTDKNCKYFCKVIVPGESESIFCHSANFVEKVDSESLNQGDLVYLDIINNEKRLSGVNISFSESVPDELLKKYKEKADNQFERIRKGIFSLRFPALTIWNHGHSLAEENVPEWFRLAIQKGSQSALEITKSESFPNSLKEELFFFLCCLHKDAPNEIGKKLVSYSQKKEQLRKNFRNIAFAIGTAELDWQQQLLKNIINPIDDEGLTRSITMEILAIALWRYENLVFKLTQEQTKSLMERLYKCIDFDVTKISSNSNGNGNHQRQFATLVKHLELLLSLLRTRASENKDIKEILSPEKKIIKNYTDLIDKVVDLTSNSKLEFQSRISLQITKPDGFYKTPDLLYALRMYLTGDSGANTIQITNVSDENRSYALTTD